MSSSTDYIDSVDVNVSSPGRNYVTVIITTRDGRVGFGDATLNGRELAVAGCLEQHCAPLLLGRDVDRIEDTWQYLYRGAYWRQGSVGMACVAAIDMALWDVKAKRADVPLYQLLGGASRTACLAYTHAFGNDLPELFDSIRTQLDRGFRAVRVQVGIPGVGPVYGVSESNRYEPATRSELPVEETWSTPDYLRFVPGVFEAIRQEFGAEIELLHDVHHRLTPIEAARLGHDLQPYRLFWLEDVVPLDDQDSLRLVRHHTTTPIAAGEVFTHLSDAHLLLQSRLIDYLRASVTHAGGVTHLRRMLDFAGFFHVKSACHGPSDISPIGLAAALHLGLAIPNFGIQEFMGYSDPTNEAFPHAYTLSDGALHPGNQPGLGAELDVDFARGFPYERAYLPVNRLRDGTVHNW